MSYAANQTPHRITVAVVRSRIIGKYGTPNNSKVSADISRLDEASEAHVKAKTAFATVNSDETMIHLIGTWSRVSRVLRELEEKYVL